MNLLSVGMRPLAPTVLHIVFALAWLSAAGCFVGAIVNFGRLSASIKDGAGPVPRWFPLVYYPASRLSEAGLIAKRKGLFYLASFLVSCLVGAGAVLLAQTGGA